MSELTNRAAYLKGLADGMKLDKEKDETKLLAAIIDFLGDVADEIQALDEEQGFIADVIDDIEEDIDTICDEIFDEYDDYDEDEDFEVICQNCGEELIVAEEELMEGEVVCPTCGETIEFDFECECDCDGECDCDCED